MPPVLKAILNFLWAWPLAALGTAALATIFQTQNLLARLNGVEGQITLAERLSMTGYDLLHLGLIYLPFIVAALLIAFLTGMVVYKIAGFGRPVVYVAAGAVAMFVLLTLIEKVFFGVQGIGGARDTVGLLFQVLAGALGGLLFERLFRTRGAEDAA